MEIKNEDGGYAFSYGASIAWHGSAEDALARLVHVPDNAGWDGFLRAFLDDKQFRVSERY